jgi:hypothetical protein
MHHRSQALVMQYEYMIPQINKSKITDTVYWHHHYFRYTATRNFIFELNCER